MTIIMEEYPAARVVDPVGNLSIRERQVLPYLIKGCTNGEIAQALGLSKRTVETHKQHVIKHLGVGCMVGLIHFAYKNKLVE